ncbi:MAG TPA: DEAD/DEAH box helicase, partial [Vicinamibacterales bacterium]|nr:DEAD/DEAH box helicase [Vicinamibacterales bacterium]
MRLDPLPIDAHVDAVVDAVRRHRAAVVVAPPGAGKTTRLPPALAADGPVLVLQPRRVAARAIARRIADERGWTLGQEVGWHVRFERRFTPSTRVLLATEGILTARLIDDPLISGVRTIVLDEFHERSIHADLGLALARQAWTARDDLRVVVMSATLAAGPVSRFLDDCPVVDVPGRPYPIEIGYAPGESIAAGVRAIWPASRGSILCFL